MPQSSQKNGAISKVNKNTLYLITVDLYLCIDSPYIVSTNVCSSLCFTCMMPHATHVSFQDDTTAGESFVYTTFSSIEICY